MGQKMLMKGNEAIAEAAVQAGCRFFFGYPITPQNQIPDVWPQSPASSICTPTPR